MRQWTWDVLVRNLGLKLSAACALCLGLGCGGDDVTNPSSGSVEISTVTSGPEPDTDGYTVTIDAGTEASIALNGTHRRDDLEPGSHSVQLVGLAANCTVAGDNPRTVSVSAGATARVEFSVTCGPTTGSLTITTSTGGPSPDADGYSITVDGSDRGTLAATADLTLTGLAPGEHQVGLSAIAANCQVQGDNPQTATVTAGASATVGFAVTCAPPPPVTGTLRISTTTTGPEPDPNGYAFTIDAGGSQTIGVNATATLANVGAGAHKVRVSGVAANCRVQGNNSRSVTVSAGGITEVSFTVTCAAITGSLKITTTTTGNAPDPDGYTIAVDNATPQTIGATATLTVPGASPGAHQVTLAGLSMNCRVDGDNPRSVIVTAAATTTVSFSLSCAATNVSKIAWDRENCQEEHFASEIWVMNADGSSQIQLTHPNAGVDPHWSPDGRKIVYGRLLEIDDHDVEEVYLINADGTGRVKLAEGSSPRWTPDGKVSFGGPGGLTIINADGTGEPEVIGGGAYRHRWSPDGKKILFLRYNAEFELDIYVMNSDGSGVTLLTHNPVDDLLDFSDNPAWSPDSRRIAFSHIHRDRSERQSQDIHVMNADGSSRTNLTENPQQRQNGHPVWWPDGSKIAFVRGNYLHMMNADGSNLVQLTTLEVNRHSPFTWSPDGTKIAIATDTGIWVINADGTEPVQLTHWGCDVNPTWSP